MKNSYKNYIKTKEFKTRFLLYSIVISFFIIYFVYMKLLTISVDFLIGFNLVCLFFVGYIFFSKWLNMFFLLKIKRIYMKFMKLFYLLNKILVLSLNIYSSLFHLLKIGFIFFNDDLINFSNNIDKLKNDLLNKFFINLFMKYFFYKLQIINKLNWLFFNNFYFIKFSYINNYLISLFDKLLICK